ncbi:MAG: hypothetical protein RL404_2451 [Pseudomonadota bacterium]
MHPKISHIQIQDAVAGGRWYAKEVASADKSEKTLVFFQREGPRSLKDIIADKLQGVRSGRSVAEKHMNSLGLPETGSIKGAIRSGNSAAPCRLTEDALNQYLRTTIQQLRQPGQAPTGQAQPLGAQAPGVSLRDAMTARDKINRDAFCGKLWSSYKGSISKADFMQTAKDAFALGTGKMTFTDKALTQKAASFLEDVAAHNAMSGQLVGEFSALQKAFARRASEEPALAETPQAAPLESSLLQALASGDKEGFCDAITQEFVRVRADKPDWNPELETLAFRARMALAFDIAKDEERVQAGVEAVGSDSQQAKQMLYLAADRGITSDPHSVNEAMRALASLPQLGIDPEIIGILNDMRELVRQSRDQDAY